MGFPQEIGTRDDRMIAAERFPDSLGAVFLCGYLLDIPWIIRIFVVDNLNITL